MKKLFSILLALTLALGMNAAFAEISPYAKEFGDYMQLPPEDQRRCHAPKINWKE